MQTRLTKKDEDNNGIYDPRNVLNELTGKEWIRNTVSIWYQRGLGKNHPETKYEKMHPAPFSYKMIERLLLFFTKKGGIVLDPFCGVGSTLKACALNERKGVGVELVDEWVNISNKRLREETSNNADQVIIKGDSRVELKTFSDNYFDYIVTSPPYWKILNKKPDHRVLQERIQHGYATDYSDDPNDLGNIDNYDEFLNELSKVFLQCYRVLKPKKYMTTVIGDFRHKSKYFMYHSDIANIMEELNFVMKGIIIFLKNAKKVYPYGYPYAFVPNIHHEYIMIFRKDE